MPIKAMPWTSLMFRKMLLALTQYPFIFTLQRIPHINKIWFLSSQMTVRINMEIRENEWKWGCGKDLKAAAIIALVAPKSKDMPANSSPFVGLLVCCLQRVNRDYTKAPYKLKSIYRRDHGDWFYTVQNVPPEFLVISNHSSITFNYN